jgi:hypothetical protein
MVAESDQSKQILKLDSIDGILPMGKTNALISRSVVYLELEGRLKVTIEAYAPPSNITGHVLDKCNTAKDICYLGDSFVELNFAWSLLSLSKRS